ncbi:MAG: hypothetical protein LBS18_06145 [Clostridiales bacterium]|nr:hypothetical protein [Clostridiales bacterium]
MRHAVVLDIGSSKIVTLCADRVGNDGLRVYGADIRAHAGFRFGKLLDAENLKRTAVETLLAAERECGFRFKEITIAAPAAFTRVLVKKGSLKLSSQPKRITGADIDMLINTSMPKEPPEGFCLIHSTPFSYTLDGKKRYGLPQDAMAAKFEAEVSHVYVSTAFLEPVKGAIKYAGMQPGVCVSAALAQALMVIPEKARNRPAILLDVGYTNTDVVIALQSAIIGQDVIESGGYHLASDLAYGFTVPLLSAEKVKRRYTFSLDYQDSTELIRTPEGTRSVDRAQVRQIIEARAGELCFMIDDALRELNVDVAAGPIIYLTGGGIAMMKGSREYLQDMLGIRIRKDMPWMPRMNSPNYGSVFGAMEFILHAGADTALQPLEGGVFSRLKGLFQK